MSDVRKKLMAMRSKHGADTPIGHRCSNLIGQLENIDLVPAGRKAGLEKEISKSVAELARLTH